MTHPTPATYCRVFAALVVLLGATLVVARIDLGAWNFAAAAAIATAKGLLIVLFFMHVRYSQPLTWLVAGAGFFWLVILISLTYSDYATRDPQQFIQPF
jgi:cytochrome c oxidase subunit IV